MDAYNPQFFKDCEVAIASHFHKWFLSTSAQSVYLLGHWWRFLQVDSFVLKVCASGCLDHCFFERPSRSQILVAHDLFLGKVFCLLNLVEGPGKEAPLVVLPFVD